MVIKIFRTASKIELLVGLSFVLIGFLIGSTLIGRTFKGEIQLDSQDVTQPESKPYLPEPFLDHENANSGLNSQATAAEPMPEKDVQAISPSPVNEFTNLSQEEKNCVIWKNAYPEAAYKLKQGDACY
jgi:hypothetical protein